MKKRDLPIFFALFAIFISFVNAAVYINEVELNPPGFDPGNQWIELFNTGAPTSINGWHINNASEIIANLSGIINKILIIENLSLGNEENFTLYNQNDAIKDFASISDLSNDSNTLSRLPDGTGSFLVQLETKSYPNEPFLIENKSVSDFCILKSENITLNVQVSGYCIEDVIFSLYFNSTWTNYSAQFIQGNNYSKVFQSDIFPVSNNINFTVYATDCFNRTFQDGLDSFYINSKTSLSVFPSNPDGLNNWYISSPLFDLSNSDASSLFYRWDSANLSVYFSLFGLETAPNNANITFLDVEGEALLLLLNEYKIYASTGSACTSEKLGPSHVILAIGLPYEAAHGSIRFTLGKRTTEEDIGKVISIMPKLVKNLRSISPVEVKMETIEEMVK